jgi:hypothetical protein
VDLIGGLLSDLMGGVGDFLGGLIEGVLTGLGNFLAGLFTLPEGYWESEFDHRRERVSEKMGAPEDEVERLLSVDSSEVGDIRGDYNVLSLSSSGGGSEGGSGGGSGSVGAYKFVDFGFLRQHLPTFQGWIRGFLQLLIALWNMNQIVMLIRKTYLFKSGS